LCRCWLNDDLLAWANSPRLIASNLSQFDYSSQGMR
jgi:hypothetical protein